MNLKKNIVAGFIFILILAGITISLSNYASKTGKSHQAAEEIAEGESEESDSCFTYEELPDGTLRITGYDEEKNMQNPYQVTIPSTIDGKQVSTLGKECLGASYAGNLLELTISDGITTIEENIIENASDIGLIKLPDSVISIDEKAFWRNDSQWPVAIACKDTSYAYQYAKENSYAFQVAESVLPENAFLKEYRNRATMEIPYFAHLRTEGERYDYITIEYRDNEIDKRLEGELIYHEPNEFLVLILDKKDGDILQCIDSSSMDTEKTTFCWLMVSVVRIFYLWQTGTLMGKKTCAAIRGYLVRELHPFLPYLFMMPIADFMKMCRNFWGLIPLP